MTAPHGCISKAQEFLRTTIANSATFQTLVGAGDAATALASIYHEALPPPAGNATEPALAELQCYRPVACGWTNEEEGGCIKSLQSISTRSDFREAGQLFAFSEEDVPIGIANDPSEVDLQFKNTVGQIIDDVCLLAGQAGYLAFNQIASSGPFRTHENAVKTEGDAQSMLLRFDWGAAA